MYVKFPDGEAKKSAALGMEGTNNIGELHAIGMAMDLILEAKEQPIPEATNQVLTDSTYVKGVLSLGYKAKKNTELVTLVKSKIDAVCKHNPVTIHWVAGHSNVYGNEQADRLANHGVKNSEAGIQIVDPLAATTASATTASATTASATTSSATTRGSNTEQVYERADEHDVNDKERKLLSLPARMGGMGIYNPTETCRLQVPTQP